MLPGSQDSWGTETVTWPGTPRTAYGLASQRGLTDLMENNAHGSKGLPVGVP